MQTKNKLEIEIEGNKEKIFASESIKNIIDFEEAPLNKTNNFVASIDDFSEYPVLSYSNKKDKTTMLLQVDDYCLNSIILETMTNIDIFINSRIIKSFSIDSYLIDYKINCLKSNIFLLKIKARRKDDGIWIW